MSFWSPQYPDSNEFKASVSVATQKYTWVFTITSRRASRIRLHNRNVLTAIAVRVPVGHSTFFNEYTCFCREQWRIYVDAPTTSLFQCGFAMRLYAASYYAGWCCVLARESVKKLRLMQRNARTESPRQVLQANRTRERSRDLLKLFCEASNVGPQCNVHLVRKPCL